ncbi:MAG: M48 family metallopeptidase [Ignavibacteria bacterium]|jgi:predicted Zn-dependent protease|nr:M48 family metallopeptidase [Ignavibacteria bacterium]MCU7501248.1 M48 family metallopeptidase [Ignavibacteria bacterium]MCU7513750.1 M48 family metallopeptidase [Ignavibacteria bacterium]MCU7520935.1 M48 family metallopeptidase [Ignavibacteria bacterium]MCU7524685.1 M48 family metallopeptidase [Ignavibacteria bacterium]
MKRFKKFYLLFLLLAAFSLECSTVPLTGRRQLDLVPASQMLSMSFQQYGEFLKQNKLSTDANATAMVKRVGQRIQHAVEKYMADNNLSDQLKGYQWEFNLVESKEVNAWCMPGGKVVVYTGILPLTQDESGLAVVLGHEISHAVAKHGDERMSQGLLTQLGGVALQVALQSKPQQTQQLFMAAFGVGAQVGILLPFSRTQESEADHLGLIFMSMAGYDPNTALSFWQRMAAQSKGAPPEFLSDHPSDQSRINKIKDEIPEAMKYYNKGS